MNLDEMAHDGARRKKGVQFLEAYAQCGTVAEACRRSGTSPSTHYWRLQHFSGYRKMFAAAHRAAITNAVAAVKQRLGQNPTESDT